MIALVSLVAADTCETRKSDLEAVPIITVIALVAIFGSDPGLASSQPKWYNASSKGCVLIGVHPGGLWSIYQRSVQWGNDGLSKVFGIDFKKIDLYAYFSCSVRNRLEVWSSPRLISPMDGRSSSQPWDSTLSRPTKLLEGSRGGSAYMCRFFIPPDGEHYGIDQQARMQFLSVLVVAATLSKPIDEFPDILQTELGVSEDLSTVFTTLFQSLMLASAIAALLVLAVVYRIRRNAEIGLTLLEGSSLLCLSVGYIGLLMIGGNPRVRIVRKSIPPAIQSRLPPESSKDIVKIEFGTLQGSAYANDRGFAFLPSRLLRDICQYDLEVQRSPSWYMNFAFFTMIIVLGIGTKLASLRYGTTTFETKVAAVSYGTTTYAALWVGYYFITRLLRGRGLSGPEAWMIPGAQRRSNSQYGAVLVGLAR